MSPGVAHHGCCCEEGCYEIAPCQEPGLDCGYCEGGKQPKYLTVTFADIDYPESCCHLHNFPADYRAVEYISGDLTGPYVLAETGACTYALDLDPSPINARFWTRTDCTGEYITIEKIRILA